jgi:hypothetical protein
MRSSTSLFTKMVSPNRSVLAWPSGSPFESTVYRNDTTHCHFPSLLARRHSVGHLATSQKKVTLISATTDLVQVPAARGNVMPEIDSMSDDFPALWFPMTAICGKSMSTWTLHIKSRCVKNNYERAYPVLCNLFIASNFCRIPWLRSGSDSPTGSTAGTPSKELQVARLLFDGVGDWGDSLVAMKEVMVVRNGERAKVKSRLICRHHLVRLLPRPVASNSSPTRNSGHN